MKPRYVIFITFIVIILSGCGGKDGVDIIAPEAPEETGTLPTDPTTDANTRVATNTPPTPTEVRIKTVSLSKCFVGEMCTRKIEADGASAYKWEIGLPGGFTLKEPTDGQKVTFSGTASEAGTLKIQAKVSDRADETRRAQKELKLVVSKPSRRELGLEEDITECFYGEDCEGTLMATGGSRKYTWVKKSGELPDGLSWKPTNDNKVVEIKGRPTRLGISMMQIALSDQEDESATIERDIELTVRDRVEIKFYAPGTNGGWEAKNPEVEIKIPSGGELKVEVTGHAPRYAATLIDESHKIAWDCNTCETKSGGLTLYRYPDSGHAFLGEGIIGVFVNEAYAALGRNATTSHNATAQTLPSARPLNTLAVNGLLPQRKSPNGKTFYLTADENSLGRKFERVKINVEDEYGNKNPPTEIKSIVFEAPVVPPPPPPTVTPNGHITNPVGDVGTLESSVTCNEDPKKPSVVAKIYAAYDYDGVHYIRFGCKELNELSDPDTEPTLAKEGWGDQTKGTAKGFTAPAGFALVGWRTTARYPGHILSLTPYAKKVDEFGVHDKIVWRGPKIYNYGEGDEKHTGGSIEIDDNICPNGEVLIGGMGGGTDKVTFLTGMCGRVDGATQRPNIKGVTLEKPQEIKLEPPIGNSNALLTCRQTCWVESRPGIVVGVGIHNDNSVFDNFPLGERLLCAEIAATDGSLLYKGVSSVRVLEAMSTGNVCGSWDDNDNDYRYLNLGYVATGFYGGTWQASNNFSVGLLSAPFDVLDFQSSYEILNGWPIYNGNTVFGIPGKVNDGRTRCPEGSVLTGITFTHSTAVISGIASFECAQVNIVRE